MAKLCFSYLIFDTPARPLSGSPQDPAQTERLDDSLPFLGYAAKFWAQHIVQGLRLRRKDALADVRDCCQELVPFFSKFLSEKSSVTVWVEASWTFGVMPRIDDLVHELRIPFLFSSTLEQLSRDLIKLGDDWGHLLTTRPNEIWGHSVSAFNSSKFWVSTSATTITPSVTAGKSVIPEETDTLKSTIFNASKVSADGQRIGIIEIFRQ